MAQAVESGAVTPAKPARAEAPKKAANPAYDKKKEGKPGSKPGAKPGFKSGGKPFDKPKGKPAPKPAEPAPSAKPRHSAPASDTSRRFTPPGMPSKPGSGKAAAKARAGSGVPPKRRKP